jgi:hypothetical protein
MRKILLDDWDESRKGLKEKAELKSRKITIGQIAEEMLNESIFSQISNSASDKFSLKKVMQANLLEPDLGNFEILKNDTLYSIKAVRNFAGYWNKNQFEVLLTEDSLTNTMCLLGPQDHETCVFYDASNDKPWCFYDPNYSNKDADYTDIQRFATKDELIKRLFKKLGNELSIRFAILAEKNKKYENSNLPSIFTLDYKEILDLQTNPWDGSITSF